MRKEILENVIIAKETYDGIYLKQNHSGEQNDTSNKEHQFRKSVKSFVLRRRNRTVFGKFGR